MASYNIMYPTFLVLGCAVLQIYGSTILFTSIPRGLAPPVTSELDIVCALANNARLDEDPGEESSEDDVLKVIQLLVTRQGGEEIARVTEEDGSVKLAGDPNLSITGSVSEEAFLALDWKRPNITQSGSYSCEIRAKQRNGEEVIFQSPLNIGAKEPGLDDVVDEMAWMKYEMDLRPVPQTLHGTGKCGSTADWKKGPRDRGLNSPKFNTVKQDFETPFLEDPVFRVYLTQFEFMFAVRIKVNVRKVTRSGFEVECVTSSGAVVNDVQFDWIALSGQ